MSASLFGPPKVAPASGTGTTSTTSTSATVVARSSTDDLIDELFPSSSKPPLTAASKSCGALLATTTASAGQGKPPAAAAKHSFDDSSDESSSPLLQAGTGLVGVQTAIGGGATRHSATIAFKRSVPFPVFPPTSGPGALVRLCKLRQCTLSCRVVPGMPHGTDTAPGVFAARGNGGPCPFIRCMRCDLPVVRLAQAAFQKAYVGHGSAVHGSSSSSLKSCGQQQSEEVIPKQPKTASHSFDDDDDDGGSSKQPAGHPSSSATQPASSSTSPGDVSHAAAMYMQVRNHYPDWTAFDPAALRRQSTDQSSTLGSSCVYCCQCSWATVTEDSLVLTAAFEVTAGGAGSSSSVGPPRSLRVVPGDPTASSCDGLLWECKGHLPGTSAGGPSAY